MNIHSCKRNKPESLRKRTSKTWERMIKKVVDPKYQTKVAVTIWWDFVDVMHGKFGETTPFFRDALDDYDHVTDASFSGAEIVEQLRRIGYAIRDCGLKKKSIDDLLKVSDKRDPELQKKYKGKYEKG